MSRKFRRGDDRIVAGVCSGIAAYFETDTQAIRVLYAVLTVCTAIIPGTLIYVILWIVMRPSK